MKKYYNQLTAHFSSVASRKSPRSSGFTSDQSHQSQSVKSETILCNEENLHSAFSFVIFSVLTASLQAASSLSFFPQQPEGVAAFCGTKTDWLRNAMIFLDWLKKKRKRKKLSQSEVGSMHELPFRFEMRAMELLCEVSLGNGQRAKELSW